MIGLALLFVLFKSETWRGYMVSRIKKAIRILTVNTEGFVHLTC
jgi:hypothetical protein